MHNVHCQRKLALCIKCDEPVPRCELSAHNTNFHAVVECPACGHQCEKRYLTDHQVSKKKKEEEEHCGGVSLLMHAVKNMILARWQFDEDSGMFQSPECVIRYLSSCDTGMFVCGWLFYLLYIAFLNIYEKKVNNEISI